MGDKWDRDLFENHLMGYSMRSARYRLVVWTDHRDKSMEPLFIELYDHRIDPQETENVAEQNPELVQKLFGRLKKQLRSH